jgi:hypothetical protein
VLCVSATSGDGECIRTEEGHGEDNSCGYERQRVDTCGRRLLCERCRVHASVGRRVFGLPWEPRGVARKTTRILMSGREPFKRNRTLYWPEDRVSQAPVQDVSYSNLKVLDPINPVLAATRPVLTSISNSQKR